jgi:hypothetical protein
MRTEENNNAQQWQVNSFSRIERKSSQPALSAPQRSTKGAYSLMVSLLGGSLLVQAIEVMHTSLTGYTYRSDQSELRRPEGSACGRVHV